MTPSRIVAFTLLVSACGQGPGFVGPREDGRDLPELPTLCVDVQPSLIDFGEHRVGEEPGPLLTYSVGNTCLTDLVVSKIEFDQDAPPYILEPPLDGVLTLRAGESRAFGVRFEPDLYLRRPARILIHSNDTELPIEVIALQGFGTCMDGETDDVDEDLVPDACDVCPDGDDRIDFDGDGVPDECDFCPTVNDAEDEDGDGVADPCDICPGDDKVDIDNDGVPDDCDRCLLGSDHYDADLDFVPDACDVCPDFNDHIDTDLDGFPEACDICPGFNDNLDFDSDGVPNGCDVCEGHDDSLDEDDDGIPDGCDT